MTGGYKGLQGVARGCGGLQVVTGGYEGLQGVTGVTRGYRWLQGVTRGYKTRISRLVEVYFFCFPILSSKDDISFDHVLGSAHVKFERLNQQSNLIVWVDLNRY